MTHFVIGEAAESDTSLLGDRCSRVRVQLDILDGSAAATSDRLLHHSSCGKSSQDLPVSASGLLLCRASNSQVTIP